MKRSIKGYENMSHHGRSCCGLFGCLLTVRIDIMDILRLKKASHLSTFAVSSLKKRVKSSAIVQDDDFNDNAEGPPAGSSNGVDTQAGSADIND
jgi:hypothetical protein